MDISAIKKEVFEAWVPFDVEAEVEVLVRFVPREVLVDIGKQAVVTKLDPLSKKEVKEYDVIAADVLIAKASVIDWRGLTFDGAEFPCTPENIELLIRKWGEFSKFVSNACVDVSRLAAAAKEKTEKN